MKKSNKYLALLIVALFCSAILFCVALHLLPGNRNLEYSDVIDLDATEAESHAYPMVDMDINSININNIAYINDIEIIGVDNPKDQEIVILGSASVGDDFYDNLSITTVDNCLEFKNPENNWYNIKNIKIYVTRDKLKNIRAFPATSTDNFTLTNLNADELSLTLNTDKVNANDCNISTLIINESQDMSETWYTFAGTGKVGQLVITEHGGIGIDAANLVDNITIIAESDITVAIKGYDKEPNVVKNGHRVWMEQE